jgi:putative phage-type endonuclease
MSMFKTHAPDKFNNATLLGVFEAGSDEWHNARKDSIGGSEISTIMGLNPFESAYALWAKKTGKIPSQIEENWAIRFGKAFELPILQLWSEEHPEYEVFLTGTYQDALIPFRHANPDALARHKETGEWIVIEVKTGRQTWEELPAGYYLQVQWYLDILGLKKAALVAVAGMTWHDYWIERDDFEIDIARQKAIDFQACMFADQRPEWDGSESTYEAVRYQHPLIDETEVEIDSLHYLSNAQAKYDEAAEELRLIKSQVLDAMGRAKHAYMEVDGQKVRIASRQAKGEGLPYLVVKKGKK